MNKIIKTASIALALSIIILAISTIRADAKRQNEWESSRETITITIRSGDSLDGYWAEYAPEWMSREQYRAEIKKLNNLKSAMIYAGNTIQLYTEGEN